MQNVKLDAFNIVGISVRTTNQDGKALQDIADLWQQFIQEDILNKIPNKVNFTIYSLYTEYEGDHTMPYTTIIGCLVNNLDSIPSGMIGKSFDAANYVKTSAKGDLTKGLIADEWNKIFDMKLDRAFVADFEVFGEEAQNPLDAKVDFYVGVNSH